MTRYRVPSPNAIPMRLKEHDTVLRRLLSAAGAPFVPVPLYQPAQLSTADSGWHQILAGTAAGPGSWWLRLTTSATAGGFLRLVVAGAAQPQVAADADMTLTAALPADAGRSVVVALEGALMAAGPMTVTVLDSRIIPGGTSS